MRQPTAFVLMTAMPPTKGHLHLIQFAHSLARKTVVLVCTQPSEPYANERYQAVFLAAKDMHNVTVRHLHKELPQNPDTPGFWEVWDKLMGMYGFVPGDYVVSSEPYGQTLADRLGGVYIPYDVKRQLYYTKATNVRIEPEKYFVDVMPTFQHNLRRTVTIFGAESTGKTTLSHELSIRMNGHWLFEYARPYLEQVGSELTTAKMEAIWHGQKALQKTAAYMFDKPWVIQDTDLFSTVGYWGMWQDKFGITPPWLRSDALVLKSDLYIITPSNIPFEADPLRYGGAERESSDDWWTSICKFNNLNYRVLSSTSETGRLVEAAQIMREDFRAANVDIEFDRMGL